MEKDCIFCKIVNKDMPANIIYEDELTLAFLDIFPNSEGHTLVITKKHFKDLMSTDEEYLLAVTKTRQKVGKLLMERLNPKGLNFASNNGEEAFQVIFHYHEHIVPKYVKKEGLTYKIIKDDKKLRPTKEIYEIITK